MAAPTSGASFNNFSASTAPFQLIAGVYAFGASGTFSGATLALSILGPDGSTYLALSSLTQAGMNQPIYIPFGATCKIVVSGGTPSALYAMVARVQVTGAG